MPSNYAEDRNINTDSDSDASIVLIDEVNADDVGEIKDIKTEIPRTSMETDFLTDRSDTGNERTAEEIPLHYEHMDYSIDANKSLQHLIQLYQMDLTMSIHLLNLYSSFYLLSRLNMKL